MYINMEREMLGNLFRYEDDKLYRKGKGRRGWVCCNDLKPHPTGYVRVTMNERMVRLHRLVYLFHNPEWNIHDSCRDNSIDHINRRPLDNRIENLRVVTHSQNLQNKTHYRGEPITGVSFNKRALLWYAQWQENGKRKGKCFKTEAEALEHRAKMVGLHYTHDPKKREKGSSPTSPSQLVPMSSAPVLCAPSPSSSAD